MRRAALSLVFVLVFSCAGKPKHEFSHDHFRINRIKVRRPPGPGATPGVSPGGVDYTARPLPDERLDCKNVPSLFEGIDLGAVRKCFENLQDPMLYDGDEPQYVSEIEYRLMREPIPYMKLETTDEDERPSTPECLKDHLSKIPVPREVIYMAINQQKLKEAPSPYSCYSSRVPIEADKVLGIKLPKAKLALSFKLPLTSVPVDDAETVRMLSAWALTPLFKDHDTPVFHSKYVPNSICSICFGRNPFDRPNDERFQAEIFPEWP